MKKSKDIITCALDIGSDSIKAALGRYDGAKNYFTITTIEFISPTGAVAGAVSDMSVCSRSISKIISKIESKAKAKIDYLFLVISNSQIEASPAKGVCLLEKERRVTRKEAERAVRSSVEFYLPLNRKDIEVIVKEYIVDGQRGILDPVGMFGKKIEARTVILHAPVGIITNMMIAVEEAGYTAADVIASASAQAEYLLTLEEKETGSLIIDGGDKSTNFVYVKSKFINEVVGSPTGLSEVAAGISAGFGIPYEYARQMSEGYFNLTHTESNPGTNMLLRKGENSFENVLQKDFCLKGKESLGELFAAVEKHAGKQGKAFSSVLCGGAALIEGLPEKLEEYSPNLKVGRISPDKIKLCDPSFNNPLFLNSITGCAYGFKILNQKRLEYLTRRRFLGRLFLKIKDLVEEYF
ncbi:MAG: hypothetical protein ABH836_03360 [Candidatus Omnitrophota bacterium]